MTLPETLVAYRTRAGYSQKKVADYLGITRQAYSHYEVGRRRPDYELLVKLGEFYSVRVSTLLGEDTAAEMRTPTDKEIMFALFGGDVENITDEMYNEVRRFAAYVKEKNKKE